MASGSGARPRRSPDVDCEPAVGDAHSASTADVQSGPTTLSRFCHGHRRSHRGTPARRRTPPGTTGRRPPARRVDIVVPVYNEEADLEPERPPAARVPDRAASRSPGASPSPTTPAPTARRWSPPRLAAELPGVRVGPPRGEGPRPRAAHGLVARATPRSLAYMDVDLSTDLDALLPLVAPLLSGHSDLAIGSRLARSARVVRGPKREVISRGYNLLLRGALRDRFSDAQCGFKAIRADRARALLPLVADTGWFFDTELLVLAERTGLRIHEVPVDWVDDPDSRVDIVATAVADLQGVVPARPRPRDGPAAGRGAAAGRCAGPRGRRAPRSPGRRSGSPRSASLSTVAYLLLYLAAAAAMLGASAANALALLVTALGQHGRQPPVHLRRRAAADGAVRHHLHGLALFGAGLALSSAAADPAARRRSRAGPRARDRRARRREPRRDRAPLRRACAGGSSRPPAPRPSRPRNTSPGGDPMTTLGLPAGSRAAAADGAPVHAAGRRAAPRWVRPGAAPACSSPTAAALPVGPRRVRLGQRLLLRRRPGRRRRAGRRSSSAPPTPRTPSPSTSRRRRCGSWACRPGSSASTRGACSCRRRSWASRRSGCSTPTVRRRFAAAGRRCSPGAVLALTPVAVLMFRFNNPDALLVLLLVGAAYALTRALERGRTAGSCSAACCVGFALPAKMLQAFLVVPGVRAGVPARGADVAAPADRPAAAAPAPRCSSSAGWWVAIVELWPASSPAVHRRLADQQRARADLRLQRLRPAHRQRDRQRRRRRRPGGRPGSGARPASPGCSPPRSAARSRGCCRPRWCFLGVPAVDGPARAAHRRPPRRGAALGRLAASSPGSSSASRRGSSTPTTRWPSRRRSAPSSASAAGWRGATAADRVRGSSSPAVVIVTAVWSYALLDRSPDWLPWLRPLVLLGGFLAAVGFILPFSGLPIARRAHGRRPPGWRWSPGSPGPAAYAVATAATPHTGSIPSAGPAVAGGFGPGGGGAGRVPPAVRPAGRPGRSPAAPGRRGGTRAGGQGFGGGPPGRARRAARHLRARRRPGPAAPAGHRRRRGPRRRSAPTAPPASSSPPGGR